MNPLRNKFQNNKNFFFSSEGLLFIAVLFWFAVLFRNSFFDTSTTSLTPLWIQLFNISWHIFIFIFLILLAWGVGRKFSKAIKISYSDISEEFSFAVSIGLGIICFLMLILGSVKILYAEATYILTAIVFLFVIKELKEIFLGIGETWKKKQNQKTDIISVIVLSFIGLTVLLLFTGTFTPPLSYDGIAYHLGVIKSYIKSHAIIPLPYHVYSNFPFNMEMLYTYSILFTRDEILAKMFHFLMAILSCSAIYSFGKKYLDRKIGLLSAALFLNTRLVNQLSS
ncbi:MAG: hypothetical protein PHW62_02580, partial [Candidatus Ratteibacteria bacterium]|nr:hypothetical protein [Candidatus Ratteibacteria bacterium]